MEFGETVEHAAVRETREETQVEVRPESVMWVADYIEKQEDRIRWHYVLIDVVCRYLRGEPFPRSDATNAAFVEMRELGELDLVPSALDVIGRAARERSSAAPVADDGEA